jgi:trimethylamine--corrinoid protein Co-methyltransferase
VRTLLQTLSEEQRAQVHERSLSVLSRTGVRVDTAKGRAILENAGADVDRSTCIVRFPRALVEDSLRSAPKDFTLGARRSDWDLRMNSGDCTLLVDGKAIFALDRETGERRAGTFDDWLEATRLTDALDEIGLYWDMIERSDCGKSVAGLVTHWRHLFRNFSKHVQDGISTPEEAPWLLEVLQVVFGDKETIRRLHPLSCILCPQSPLIIEGTRTDAYLELLGWDIPVAVMPMPLMGSTGPGSLISTTVLGNCEVLAMLCLVQAGAPGTPFLYAPALAMMNPYSGGYSAGAIEGGLLAAAAVEMARHYGLPVEASGMATEHYVPGIQATYESSMNGLLAALAWPDILVGCGLMGGSMVLCLEQLLIDVETFRMSQRAHQGIAADDGKWLEDVIHRVGPGGHFLTESSTATAFREGEMYVSQLGWHDSFEAWEAAGMPTLLEEAREKVAQILAAHQPLPLGEDVERELDRIQKRAQSTIS